LSGFVGAVQFLTRVPIRTKRAVPHERVVPWLAVVGCLIGAAVGGVAAGLWHVVPPLVAGACAVALGMIITGAFHEDGLADTADAFGGGWDRERRLEIMKDSRHGTYGVAALSASVVIRVAAAGAFTSPWALFRAFVVAHALARAAAMGTMLAIPPASTSGLGYQHSHQLRRVSTIVGMFVALAVSGALLGRWALLVVGCVLLTSLIVGWLSMRKIGGIVGDVLGAVEQVGECVVLVVVSGLAVHGRV